MWERLCPASDGFPAQRAGRTTSQFSVLWQSPPREHFRGHRGFWATCEWHVDVGWRRLSTVSLSAAGVRFSCAGSCRCSQLAASLLRSSPSNFWIWLTGLGQKRQIPTLTSTISIPSQPQSTFTPRYPDLAPFQLPDLPGSQPVPWPTFSRLLLLFSPGASLTMLRCCTQPGRSTKLSRKNIASWSQSTTRWGPTPKETGCNSSSYVSLWGLSNINSAFRRWLAHFSRASLLVYWLAGSCACQWVSPGPHILLAFQTESHRELRMVPLLRVLGQSPASRSPFGIKLRWLGQFLPAHVPSHFPRFRIWFSFLSVCVKSGAFFPFFTSAWTCLLARSLLIICVQKKKKTWQQWTSHELRTYNLKHPSSKFKARIGTAI